MNIMTYALTLVLMSGTLSLTPPDVVQEGDKAGHEIFDNLLKKHVSVTGVVDYSGLASDRSELNRYTRILSENAPTDYWTRDEQLAYWINAYNAFTLTLIVDNLPVSSITSIEGGKPWDKKWISIRSATYSLNDIENDIIRSQFYEPRIHFAVNCAAKSCPPLLNRAWTADNLEINLDRQTRKFINDGSYNVISNSSAKVSKIFEWYSVDFGDLRRFINRYSETQLSDSAKISYNDYNWGLNGG